MTRDCNGSCDEHSGLLELVSTVKGQLSILLKLMVILVAGMGYAITQNHQVDNELSTLNNRVTINESYFNTASKSHLGDLASFEVELSKISNLCCGELD